MSLDLGFPPERVDMEQRLAGKKTVSDPPAHSDPCGTTDLDAGQNPNLTSLFLSLQIIVGLPGAFTPT